MQIHYFSTGGFVVHKCGGDQRVSAWFDASGNLLDCERRDGRGASRKPNKATREWLAKFVGPLYAQRSAANP